MGGGNPAMTKLRYILYKPSDESTPQDKKNIRLQNILIASASDNLSECADKLSRSGLDISVLDGDDIDHMDEWFDKSEMLDVLVTLADTPWDTLDDRYHRNYSILVNILRAFFKKNDKNLVKELNDLFEGKSKPGANPVLTNNMCDRFMEIIQTASNTTLHNKLKRLQGLLIQINPKK